MYFQLLTFCAATDVDAAVLNSGFSGLTEGVLTLHIGFVLLASPWKQESHGKKSYGVGIADNPAKLF